LLLPGSIVADNEALRRYLEQQRDLGDRVFVLETILSKDVSALLRAANRPDWRSSLRNAGLEVDAPLSQAPHARTAVPRATPGAATATAASEIEDGMKQKKGKVVEESSKLFDAPIAELGSLKAIAEKVAGCKACVLYETARNGVPGEGNPNARVVCVGEGPGANEDESGLPFVGAAGALLTKILESVKLSREEVFITNVVKHRPPGNRNPLPEEVDACSPYLVRQLELIKPKVIIAFGNFAAQTLLNTKDGVGKLRGVVHTYEGIPLVVTYHPAALLRNPNWKRPTWEDVKLARRVLDNAESA
jgi:uracil-DNA glycosylase family 4